MLAQCANVPAVSVPAPGEASFSWVDVPFELAQQEGVPLMPQAPRSITQPLQSSPSHCNDEIKP